MKLHFILCGALLTVSPALSSTLAMNFPNTVGNATGNNSAFTLGWAFTVQQTITVSWLDFFDSSQDGLTDSHSIGIWDSSGTC